MPALSADQWEQVRAEREAGTSFRDLAKKWGVSHQTIVKRARKEKWANGQDVQEIIRKKTLEKIAGIVTTGDPKKRAEAIDAAADRGAEIIRKHREEVGSIRERLHAGLEAHRAAKTKEQKQLAFEDLKAAKIASETLLNIHKAERQAWGLEVQTPSEIVIRNPRKFDE